MKKSLKIAALLWCSCLILQVDAHFRVQWDNSAMHDFNATQITVTVDTYAIDPVTIEGKEYSQVRLPGSGFFAPKGFPQLPCINKAVIIPDDRKIHVDILSSQFVDIPVIGIAPSKGRIYHTQNPLSIPYCFNEMYQRDQWYPENQALVGDPFIYRDFRGCIVQVFPFQYNPVRKTLRVYSKITLNVVSDGAATVNVFKRIHAPSSGIDPEFAQMYEQNFLNYPKTTYPNLAEGGSMLIICPATFTSLMQPYADWKMKKGIAVAMVDITTAGSTASGIKTYIANAYNKTGSTLKYVLLVGSAALCPTPKLPAGEYEAPDVASNGGDIIYGQIKGSDCYPELLVGRFSGSKPEDIQTQVDRSIYYETKMKSTDTWLSNMLLTASNDSTTNQWAETDAAFVNHEYDTLIKAGYTATTAMRYNQSGVGGSGCKIATPAAVTTVINTGISAWNYCDHGYKEGYPAADFDTGSAKALNNTNKYFFTYAVACNSGEFGTGGNCLGEALMKAQRNNRPIGAIGCYMGSIAQVWDPPYATVKEVLEIILGRYPLNRKYTLGGVMINAGMAAYPVYNDLSSRGVVDSYILFGDPSLQIYTATPKPMTITHPVSIGVGSQTVKITGTADGATVCIYNAKESIQTVGSVSGGSVSFSVNPTSIGDTLAVTATLFNYETYQGTIIVGKDAITRRSGMAAQFKVWCDGDRIYYQAPNNGYQGAASISIRLFSVDGVLVAALINTKKAPGSYSVAFDRGSAFRLARGMYLADIKINEFSGTLKIIVK